MKSIPSPHDFQIALENSRFMSRVYVWMTLGILLTAIIASYFGNNEALVMTLIANPLLFWGLIILQLVAVFFLAAMIQRINSMTAMLVYLIYAALTGVTCSVVFLIYTKESIADVFLVTACAFGGLSAFGYFTKKDLGPIGTFCGMALWGLIGFGILSFFLPSFRTENVLWWRSLVGLIIFSGLTAYDTQKIKQMNIIGNEGTDEDAKEAIFGALTLYLDFINLFLDLLRLMGRRRD